MTSRRWRRKTYSRKASSITARLLRFPPSLSAALINSGSISTFVAMCEMLHTGSHNAIEPLWSPGEDLQLRQEEEKVGRDGAHPSPTRCDAKQKSEFRNQNAGVRW